MAPVLDRFQSLHAVDFAAIAAYFTEELDSDGVLQVIGAYFAE